FTTASAAALSTSSALSWERTLPTDRKPLAARSSATASPMPELAPVVSTVRMGAMPGVSHTGMGSAPELVLQMLLEDLAHRIPGQVVHQLELLGALLAGQALGAAVIA